MFNQFYSQFLIGYITLQAFYRKKEFMAFSYKQLGTAFLCILYICVGNSQPISYAAIGNMVPQLHLHIIARFDTDAAWPKPVWGFETTQPYSPENARDIITQLQARLVQMPRD